MSAKEWKAYNPSGRWRVIVTKELPGKRWLEILTQADCRVEICMSEDIVTIEEIRLAMGDRCDGCIGQLTERWNEELFAALKAVGGKAYSNCAVGYNNVDVDSATRMGIPVGNTPGVLTETTAEAAVALTFAAVRRIVEADSFMRGGHFKGWLPNLFLGELLWRKTVGIIGAGRIGAAYARMMVEGHKMNLVYYDLNQNEKLEGYIEVYGKFLASRGEDPVSCRRASTLEDLLREADVVSVHAILDQSTHHMINAERLALMKENAVLVNTSRGPLIDEAALVAHCERNPSFRAGLDVYEHEPSMKPGLSELANVVIVPHIGSATRWTRQGMVILAACNISGILNGYPVWQDQDVSPFLGADIPQAAPSIVNARALGMPVWLSSNSA